MTGGIDLGRPESGGLAWHSQQKCKSLVTYLFLWYQVQANACWFTTGMLVQEEMQAEATLFCGFVIAVTHPGTQIRLCGLAHLSWQKKRNLLRFLVSSKSVFQTWHRIVRALKTQEANPCPNTREIWMVPENRHLSGLTCGTGLDWWLVEIEIKWESRHVKEGWGKNKIPLSLIQGKTEASQELNCKINRKWIREKYEKSH